ncbi:MAG TPA: hypothetical protein VEJ20_02015, partial [Candidatus Eremiobacteraceae bacterium]|nr:hypothetical protein [Candidatus Eremiobacteraceae bacterium]
MTSYFGRHPFAAGVASAVAVMLGGASLAAAANHVHPFVLGTVDYEDTTSGPIVLGVQSGSGIGVEGVTNTGAPAGAIALDGFGTSTTAASVGVNGSVDGPGSTALIGNANDTSGSASIGLEGFSANGEGVFAQSTNNSWESLRSVDDVANYDVRLSDVPDLAAITALLNTDNPPSSNVAIVGNDTVSSDLSLNIGVLGETASGLYGVEGTAGGNASDGVYGVGTTSVTGVEGASDSGDGVAAESNSGDGLYAGSDTGTGAYAVSGTGQGIFAAAEGNADGIEAETENESATTLTSEAGVFGLDNSDDGGTDNVGVEGISADGTGVEGFSTDGNAVYGDSQDEDGVLGVSSDEIGVLGITDADEEYGVEGINFSTDCCSTGGVFGFQEDGTGVWGEGTFGLVGQCVSGGDTELYLEDQNSENYYVDCTGFQGTVVRSRHGQYAVATTPKSTQPVLEDYGEAQLINGDAQVRLDPAFADTISDRTPYLVFVTPDGDTNGLYVTNKTLTGFEVREVRGGHSSLTFDYRIVAKPADDNHPRMA